MTQKPAQSRTRTTALRAIAATVCAAVVLGGPVAALASTSTPTASNSATATQHAARGAIVSAKRVQHLTAKQVRDNLKANSFDRSKVKYGVDAYRIVYRTVDENGHPTTASGLVVIPRNEQRRLRLVNYTHGTMAGKNEAPSVDDHGKSTEGLMMGSAGYAVVEPDYLGLGLGPGEHPYLQSTTETSASTDMLRAAFSFSHRVNRQFDHRVLVTGFSQGGKIAMLVTKALQAGAIPGVRPAAVAPISGPYDLLNAELPAIFAGDLNPAESTYYLTYFLTAWNRTYHLYNKPSDAFQAPYDTTLAPLFNGKHSDDEIFAKLAPSPEKLLTPAFLAQLRHPTGALLKALKANDNSCTGWRPRVPVQIYASHGDEVVSINNAYHCQQELADRGAEVSLIDVGKLTHNDSGRHGLAGALRFFLDQAPPVRK